MCHQRPFSVRQNAAFLAAPQELTPSEEKALSHELSRGKTGGAYAQMTRLLASFFKHVDSSPRSEAVNGWGRSLTYGELGVLVRRCAAALKQAPAGPVGLFSYESVELYAYALAAMVAGRAFVPLNPTYPPERTRQMCAATGLQVLLLSADCEDAYQSALCGDSRPKLLLCLDTALADRLEARAIESEVYAGDSQPDGPAYILFTSGSTGRPKGVVVTRGNLDAYIETVAQLTPVRSEDRLSHAQDLTFDLSMHNVFLAFYAGAALYCLPKRTVFAPGQFIRKNALTYWSSVPSVGVFMEKLGMLKPGMYPLLRYIMFNGEALPARIAQLWAQAAPNAKVINFYGPTEVTVSATWYPWTADSLEACENGIVPLGRPLATASARVVDATMKQVSGAPGELLLGGVQVAQGYLGDPERTRSSFIELADAPGIRWYRTGDLVRVNSFGDLVFLGRMDNQVQIRGYRVELAEVEGHLRELSGCAQCAVIPYPVRDGVAEGLVAFVEGLCDEQEVLNGARSRFPAYMVPQRLVALRELPYNLNGKIDRIKLNAYLEEN